MPADGPCYAILGEHVIASEEMSHIFPFPVVDEIPASYVQMFKESPIPSAKYLQGNLWSHRWSFLKGASLPYIFYGIAAMPSLHVAAVTMMACFLFSLTFFAGIMGSIFALTTFVASIFLQWHYAVDGYVGFALGWGVYLLSRKIGAKKLKN